jgi:hypothetical protein
MLMILLFYLSNMKHQTAHQPQNLDYSEHPVVQPDKALLRTTTLPPTKTSPATRLSATKHKHTPHATKSLLWLVLAYTI